MFCIAGSVGQDGGRPAFFGELEGERKNAFTASEQRINITKESWHLQHTPQGDLLIAYVESPDFANALESFSGSRDEFDEWFKQRLAEVTGIDFNNPPPGSLSEQLSTYQSV